MVEIADMLSPPYYAIIFTSRRTAHDDGYEAMAIRMVDLATRQPGFLGWKSVREAHLGITVSYWPTEEDIQRWKQVAEHRTAQSLGKERWYASYRVRVCRVEREYGFER